ncbi:MAG: hypothetical protein H5U17_14435 [Defluviimonas sp.]|nr:hypothetical protein [Defluviimonas sp.]
MIVLTHARRAAALLGAGVALTAALPVSAQQMQMPLEEGFYARGGLEAEYLSYGDEDTSGAYLDFNIGIGAGTLFGVPVGIELGAEGVSESESESAFYGAVSFDTGFGVIGLGVPRFALDKYVSTPSLGGFRLVEVVDFGLIDGRGVSGLYYLASSDVPYGISYDLAGTNFAFGLTYHEYDDEGETSVIQAAGNVRAGAFIFGGGAEYLESDVGDGEFYTASVQWQTDRFGLGAQYSQLDADIDFAEVFGDDFAEDAEDLGVSDLTADGQVDATKLWATWRPIDQLDLTASYVLLDDEDLYGLNARYTVAGFFVEGGAVDGVGDETLYQASIGFDF